MQPRNNPKSKKYKSKKAKKSKLPASPESLTPSDAPSFSENEKKVVYWKGIIEFEKREALADFPEIAQLFKNKALPFLRLNKKWCSVSGVTILGTNVNYSDRLLFWEYTNPFKDQYLVVLEVIWNHDYSKSLISKKRVPALKALLATYKSALDDYFNNEKKNNPENVPKALPPMGIHEGRVVVYNQDQKAKMDEDDDCNKMHVGPAGAGKTLMQDRELRRTVAKRCNEDDLFILVTTESKKVLEKSEKAYHESKEYIRTGEKIFLDEKEKEWEETFRSSSAYLDAPSEDLVKNEKIKWKASLDYLTLKKVIFSDFEGLFTLYAKDLIRCGQDNFMHWLPDHIKLLKNTDTEKYLFFITANLKQVYHALMISAIYEKAFFVDKVGKKQCNFRAKNEKAWLWETCQSYKKYLMDNKLYHPAFSRIKLPTLTAAFMDEVHNLTLMQILNIKESCKVKVCVAIDHRQNLDGAIYPKRLPIMNILSQSPNKIALKVIELKCSERCPVQLEGTLNLLLDKTCLLGGGNPDPTYKSIECHGKQNGGIYWMSSFEEKSPVLDLFNKVKSLPDFVVITHEEYIEEVKKIVGPHVWVTTPEKAKGLEFDVVFVYRLFDTPAHRQASKCLSANPEKKSNGNHPKDGQGNPIHEPIMHAAYVALSRTKGICIVFHPGELHQLVKDLMEMQTKIESKNENETVNSSTPEHFLEGVIKRIENNEPSAWHYAQLNLKMDAKAFALLVEKHAPKINQNETPDEKNKKKKNRKRRNKNKKEDQPKAVDLPLAINPEVITTEIVVSTNREKDLLEVDLSGNCREILQEIFSQNQFDQLKQLFLNPKVDPDTSITIAAENGSLDLIKWLDECTSFNFPFKDHHLISAANRGHVPVVDYLIKCKHLNPAAQQSDAILFAVMDGHTEMVRYLLRCEGIDPSHHNNKAIRSAVGLQYTEIVKCLLQNEKIKATIDKAQLESYAIEINSPEIAELFSETQPVSPFNNPVIDLIKCITKKDLPYIKHLIEQEKINCWDGIDKVIEWAVKQKAKDIENYLILAKNQHLLRMAVSEGDLNEMKSLIESKNLNPSFDNYCLIEIAFFKNDFNILKELLLYPDIKPIQVFRMAIKSDNVENIKCIVTHNRDWTALHRALIDIISNHHLGMKHADTITVLLEDLPNLIQNNGNTLIQCAAASGCLPIVEYLLKCKEVDPSANDNEAIQSASQKGYVDVVECLLGDKRVDPSAENNKAIQFAAENGHLPVLKSLLKCEAVDPGANDNAPIKLATRNNHLEVVQFLLLQPRVDPSVNDNQLLQTVIYYNQTELLKCLLSSNRIDPTAHNNLAIRKAAEKNNLSIVMPLLDCEGVNPSANHNEAIKQAAIYGRAAVMGCLLRSKKLDRSDNHEVLRLAVEKEQLGVVRCLLEHKDIDPNIKGVIELAVEKGNLRIVQALCEPGMMKIGHRRIKALIALAKRCDYPSIESYFVSLDDIRNQPRPSLVSLFQPSDLSGDTLEGRKQNKRG